MDVLFNSVIAAAILHLTSAHNSEPSCVCSKFAYEESLLERMIRTEINVEQREKAMSDIEERLVRKEEGLTKLEEQLHERVANLSQEHNKVTEQLWAVHNQTVAALKDRVLQPLVAFHATFIEATNPSPGQVIIFTKTSLNAGGGYDKDTGMFTAPVSGVYQLSVHLCASSNKYMYFDIVADGKILLSGVQGDKSYNSCGSVSVPAAISAKKQAFVRCSPRTTSPGLNEDRHNTNTFSGVLIRQLED